MRTDETGEGRQALKALARSINRVLDRGGQAAGAIPGLMMFRQDTPTEPQSCMYEPSICLVAQGRKRVFLGEDSYVYDANNYLVSSLHMPGVVHILEASAETPYLGLALRLDQRELAQLVLDSRLPPAPAQAPRRGMATGLTNVALLGAFQRLIDLAAEARDIPIMAPLIQREILYRLLVGEQGDRLRQMVSAGTRTHQIAQAIGWLSAHFRSAVSIDELAARVCMSSSAFYQHFRSMTALSPLQFQKQLRLQEARRLMLEEGLEAATAAFEVGYESPSQFNREYNRLFGAPPLRDISSYRRAAAG
ncbi:AraC family transcriptional regulator [Rugamonas sp. A1-17]|nr:AraC family transcriptional regulator [Rugamonas sp. A1-17]